MENWFTLDTILIINKLLFPSEGFLFFSFFSTFLEFNRNLSLRSTDLVNWINNLDAVYVYLLFSFFFSTFLLILFPLFCRQNILIAPIVKFIKDSMIHGYLSKMMSWLKFGVFTINFPLIRLSPPDILWVELFPHSRGLLFFLLPPSFFFSLPLFQIMSLSFFCELHGAYILFFYWVLKTALKFTRTQVQEFIPGL